VEELDGAVWVSRGEKIARLSRFSTSSHDAMYLA